ncbi:MAG: hybrid sensor histidine kinase/response regulator, partial [Alphaproteobacteria bacterium]|nr:hybrid sensor histidine kinase/response regulator [Candidatus Nitrobium versatile]
MLTGLGDTRVKIRCLEAGASDFLEKPVNPMELAIKVNNFLKLQEYEEVKLRNEILTDSKKILEEKNRELERAYCDLKSAQSQILQQEKMASIGQLAAGIAHEINNPVGFIMSNLNTLQKFATRLKDFIKSQTDSLEKMAERKEESGLLLERVREQRKSLKIDYIMGDMENLIRESFDGAARMKQIVQDLKSFSRVGEERHVPSDINAGIESTVNIVWNELKYKAVLKKEYGEIPLVRCNIGQLNQVFMNILVNAAHAIEKQG